MPTPGAGKLVIEMNDHVAKGMGCYPWEKVHTKKSGLCQVEAHGSGNSLKLQVKICASYFLGLTLRRNLLPNELPKKSRWTDVENAALNLKDCLLLPFVGNTYSNARHSICLTHFLNE